MDNQKVRFLDGAIEVSLRALCILCENQKSMTKDRIVAYDYFSLFSKDMDESLDNLMSEFLMHSTSYIGEAQTISKAINILTSRDLITFEIIDGAVYYGISEIGEALVKALTENNDYAIMLLRHIHNVSSFFKDYSEEQVGAFVKSHISNWSEEAIL